MKFQFSNVSLSCPNSDYPFRIACKKSARKDSFCPFDGNVSFTRWKVEPDRSDLGHRLQKKDERSGIYSRVLLEVF